MMPPGILPDTPTNFKGRVPTARQQCNPEHHPAGHLSQNLSNPDAHTASRNGYRRARSRGWHPSQPPSYGNRTPRKGQQLHHRARALRDNLRGAARVGRVSHWLAYSLDTSDDIHTAQHAIASEVPPEALGRIRRRHVAICSFMSARPGTRRRSELLLAT